MKKRAHGYSSTKVEPVDATESGDPFTNYSHSSTAKTSPSMKLNNLGFFDTIAVAGMYDQTLNTSNGNSTSTNPVSLSGVPYGLSSSNVNQKTNHLNHPAQSSNQHHIQSSYSPGNDYSSTVNGPAGYWSYGTQSYLGSSTRQYMPTQTATDVCSSPSRNDLSYHAHGSYPHMQKMVAGYTTAYDFYQHPNPKYC